MRILIADDDPIIRLDLAQILESLGYQVVGEAGDGQAAVDQAREQKPDCCILDIKMPIMDGIEAVRLLSKESIAPAILLTAYSDKELIDRASEAGAFAYLVKPFKPGDIPPAIELARSRFEQLLALRSEVSDLQGQLEARKLVDRAKAKLIAEQGMTESEAYRHLQTLAMNQRTSMRDIAEQVLSSVSNLEND